jgi:spermidine/putrescine transport system ATP-binding protein
MLGKEVELAEVAMRFGGFTAVHPTSLRIEAGEFFSLLGPSGCGKTTILRLVSGFLEPSRGAVRIGGEAVAGVPPNRRPTALIFQNLALFPLMPVWENVAFGLEARGIDRATRRRRAAELLELVALAGQGDKRPAELSGGQKQRVAIARALAVEPAVLLLDEPLSALDLKLRQHMRAELRAIQERVGLTFVYITHDQGEALAMSDRVAVMSHGRIEQVDTPDRLYREPATAFVATFVGENNLLRGRMREAVDGVLLAETGAGPIRASNPQRLAPGQEAMLFIRPERLELGGAVGENQIAGRITRRTLEGAFLHLSVATESGPTLLVHRVNGVGSERLVPGESISLSCSVADARALPVAVTADG